MINKEWVLAPVAPDDFLASTAHLPPLVAQLCYNRKLRNAEEIEHFLNPNYEQHVHDPYLFDDMEKAVDRIGTAIENEELIIVHGDYDADGVCGSVILVETLTLLGAKVDVYLPHREREGYGMQINTVDDLEGRGCKLIITVDCGIANAREIAYAAQKGIDVIITDHHQTPAHEEDFPKAHAIIHPRVHAANYPFDYLAGAGAAFKLVQALSRATTHPVLGNKIRDARDGAGEPINWEGYEKWLLDLVCTATITDCMPLLGENRALVKYGLMVLNKTRRIGLQALYHHAKITDKTIDTKSIGFDIGPRINAAGRMNHARVAFDLLMASTEEQAHVLAQELETTNGDRRKVSDRMSREAEKQFEIDYADTDPNCIVLFNENWPMGVLGLVAGKISNKFHKPVILLTFSKGGIEGTSRTVEGISIIEVLRRAEPLLERYGGHAAAAGLAFKEGVTVEEFRKTIHEIIAQDKELISTTPKLNLEVMSTLPALNWDAMNYLSQFEPFGQQNNRPSFLVPAVTVRSCSLVGKTGKHIRLVVEQDGVSRQAIGFSMGEWNDILQEGTLVDLACELEINEWNNRKDLQLTLLDIRKA